MPLSYQEKVTILQELQETNRLLREKLRQKEEKPWWKKELETAGEFLKFPYTITKELTWPMAKSAAKLPFRTEEAVAELGETAEKGKEMAKGLAMGGYDWLRAIGMGTTPAEQYMSRAKIGERVKEHGVLAESVHPLLMVGAVRGLGARGLPKKVKVPKIRPEAEATIPLLRKPEVIPSELPGAGMQQIIEALKKAKPIRGKQEALYTQERAKKIAKARAVGEEIGGEAGFYAEKGQLKGEMAKVQFESIRGQLTQANIDNMFNRVKENAYLTEWEKITAREGLAKMLGEAGGRVPTKGELTLLEQVFPPEFIDAIMKKRPLGGKVGEAVLQVANIPRSMMASFDLSFGFRQGAVVAPRFRKQFWAAWKKQFKQFGSERAYQASKEALVKHPDFKWAKESRIAFTELGKIMSQREERFASQWAEKLPSIVGKGVRASGRAYTGMANKLRLDVFADMLNNAEVQGLKPRQNLALSKQIAELVNMGTGRGSLGKFEGVALGLNAFFFSPRLMSSRLKLLWPGTYVSPKHSKFVRMEALKTGLAAAGTAMTILSLADLAGLEVGWNPYSADFLKIKIGKARIDIGAGFQQYIRAFAQLSTGKYVSSITGREATLGEGYKPLTRKDILFRQIESKEAPIFSFATKLLEQQDWEGRPINVPKEIGNRFVPMVIADMYDLAKESPELLPLGIPAMFGVGLMVYESYPPEVREFTRFASQVEAKKPKEEKSDVEKAYEFYRGYNSFSKGLGTGTPEEEVGRLDREIRRLAKRMRDVEHSDDPNKDRELEHLRNQMKIYARAGLSYKQVLAR